MSSSRKQSRTYADIVIAGGGTGGHVYPAIAIANALRRLAPELEIVFMGNPGKLEARVAPQHGFEFEAIASAGFPRKMSWRWLTVLRKVPLGFFQSLSRLRRWNPQAVVGTGGYVCGPILFAAALLGIPTLIQEQNAVPGLTNKILSRWADEIHIAFEAARPYFPYFKHGDIHHTGNPIRAAVTQIAGKRLPASLLGLEEGRFTITVMGGSQGSSSINQAVLKALTWLTEEPIQWIHQTGKTDESGLKEVYQEFPFPHCVQAYFENMHEVYAVTDLMICRSGGMTTSEITACGLPAILIPYPHATGDHQRLNAEALVEANAARLILDSELDGKLLSDTIKELLHSPETLRKMAEASERLGRPYAAESIAQAVLNLAGGRIR